MRRSIAETLAEPSDDTRRQLNGSRYGGRMIRHHNAHDRPGSAVSQQSVTCEQNFAQILAGEDSARRLIPVKYHPAFGFPTDGVFVYRNGPPFIWNRDLSVIPDLPSRTGQAVFRGVHAFARSLLGVKGDKEI